MKYDEFHAEIQKLIKRFGDKYYPEEVVGVLFEEVKKLDISWFRPIVAKWLGLHKPALYPEFADGSKLEKIRLGYQGQNTSHKNWAEQSMFTDGQRKFLFALTQKIVRRQIPDQNEFVKIFCPTLDKIISKGDQRAAHNLFTEVGGLYDINYEPGFKAPPKPTGSNLPGAPVI